MPNRACSRGAAPGYFGNGFMAMEESDRLDGTQIVCADVSACAEDDL